MGRLAIRDEKQSVDTARTQANRAAQERAQAVRDRAATIRAKNTEISKARSLAPMIHKRFNVISRHVSTAYKNCASGDDCAVMKKINDTVNGAKESKDPIKMLRAMRLVSENFDLIQRFLSAEDQKDLRNNLDEGLKLFDEYFKHMSNAYDLQIGAYLSVLENQAQQKIRQRVEALQNTRGYFDKYLELRDLYFEMAKSKMFQQEFGKTVPVKNED